MGSQIIPGIYNYCDRWCEHCKFHHRCRIGLEEFHRLMSREYKEESLEEVLDTIREMFTDLQDTLRESAARHGIDIDSLPEDNENPVPLSGEEEEVLEWCASFESLTDKLLTKCRNNIPLIAFPWDEDYERLVHDKVDPTSEHFDILMYYKTLLYPKCGRAFSRYPGDESDDIQSDNNGTAKVVLLCLDACNKSLQTLYTYYPDEDLIIDLLRLVKQITERMEMLFPNAYDFIRPGFDDAAEV